MTTYAEATDLMYGVAVAAVKSSQSIFGYVPEMVFAKRASNTPPDGSKTWVRIGRTTNKEQQGTLSNCEGINGAKRYDSFGLIWVQIFAPMVPGSDDKARALATLIRDAFRGKRTGSVIFMDSAIVEVDDADKSIRYNVNSEFDYSEIQ
jgi:hypothetical protein